MNYLADLGHRFGGASPSAPRPERLEAGRTAKGIKKIKSSKSEPRCGGWHAIEAHENDLKRRFLVPASSRSGDDSKIPSQAHISTPPLSRKACRASGQSTCWALGHHMPLTVCIVVTGVKCTCGGSLIWCCICARGEHSRLGEEDPTQIAHRTATFAVCKESLAPQENTQRPAVPRCSTPPHLGIHRSLPRGSAAGASDSSGPMVRNPVPSVRPTGASGALLATTMLGFGKHTAAALRATRREWLVPASDPELPDHCAFFAAWR